MVLIVSIIIRISLSVEPQSYPIRSPYKAVKVLRIIQLVRFSAMISVNCEVRTFNLTKIYRVYQPICRVVLRSTCVHLFHVEFGVCHFLKVHQFGIKRFMSNVSSFLWVDSGLLLVSYVT